MRWLAGVAVLGAGACSNAPADGADGQGNQAPPCADQTDYICDVEPLLRTHCLGCHATGGIGPFPLTTYQEARAVGPLLVESVTQGRMPPWPPADVGECPPLMDARRLAPEQIQLLQDWVAQDMPPGTPGSVAPQQQVAPVEQEQSPQALATTTLSVGEGYLPNQSVSDDYHCFIVDPALDTDHWLHGYEIVPGNRSMVHHVLLYLVMPDDLAELEGWDAAEAGPGFTCFGAPSPGIPLTLGGWVPGQRPQEFRRGDGAWVPRGARLVVQMHYNLLGGGGTDVTTVNMHWIEGMPFREVATLPYPVTNFSIPAGNANYSVGVSTGPLPEVLYSPDFDLMLEGVAPHMHTLGTAIRVELEPPGAASACLINIPRWDFNWQGFYLFEGAEPMPIPTGSGFRLTCTWDNSPENQQVVNGEQLAPRRVRWGDGTLDEMCLAYLIVSGNPGWTQTLLQLWQSYNN